MTPRARHRAIATIFAALGALAAVLATRIDVELAIVTGLVVAFVAGAFWFRQPDATWTPSPTVEQTTPLPSSPYRGPAGEIRERVPATSARAVATTMLGAAGIAAALGWLVGAAPALALGWALWSTVLAIHARRGRPLLDDGVAVPPSDEPLFEKVDWKILIGWPEIVMVPVVAVALVVARALVDHVFPFVLRWPYAAVKRAIPGSPLASAAWAAAFLAPLAPLAWLLR